MLIEQCMFESLTMCVYDSSRLTSKAKALKTKGKEDCGLAS